MNEWLEAKLENGTSSIRRKKNQLNIQLQINHFNGNIHKCSPHLLMQLMKKKSGQIIITRNIDEYSRLKTQKINPSLETIRILNIEHST